MRVYLFNGKCCGVSCRGAQGCVPTYLHSVLASRPCLFLFCRQGDSAELVHVSMYVPMYLCMPIKEDWAACRALLTRAGVARACGAQQCIEQPPCACRRASQPGTFVQKGIDQLLVPRLLRCGTACATQWIMGFPVTIVAGWDDIKALQACCLCGICSPAAQPCTCLEPTPGLRTCGVFTRRPAQCVPAFPAWVGR